MAIKARRRPVVSGREELINSEAVVLNDFAHNGTVSVHSEIWQAISQTPLHKGQRVRITGSQGLQLQVEPLPPAAESSFEEKPS